jgi:cohesin loading factor subunit SCC2
MPAAYQKFHNLLEDVFEASDSIPANPSPSDLKSNQFFPHLAKDGVTPLLSSHTVDKLVHGITRIQSSRRGPETDSFTWDIESFGRLLRLLERSMRDGEELTIFQDDIKVVAKWEKVKKVRGKKSGSKSKTPEEAEGSQGLAEAERPLSEEEIRLWESNLGRLRVAGQAAGCVLLLLSTEGLSKQVSCAFLFRASIA